MGLTKGSKSTAGRVSRGITVTINPANAARLRKFTSNLGKLGREFEPWAVNEAMDSYLEMLERDASHPEVFVEFLRGGK